MKLTTADRVGADTSKRFRYQRLWAAYFSLNLLLKFEIFSIYCEYLDDISIEFKGPTGERQIRVIQIKTSDTKKFSVSDDEIGKAIDIFLSLESKYGKQILNYQIITNGKFLQKTKNFDMQKLIASFSSHSTQKNKKAYEFLKGIPAIKTISDYTQDQITRTFKKIRIEPQKSYSYEYLDELLDVKIGRILRFVWKIVGNSELISAVKSNLMDLMDKKSSNDEFDKENPIYDFIPKEAKTKEKDEIKAKRILKEDIVSLFGKNVAKIEKEIELLNHRSLLDEQEKKSLLNIQKYLHIRLEEQEFIRKSSPNGFKITNGKVSHLKLSGMKIPIDSIPDSFFELKSLQLLSLSHNLIKEIPAKIDKLKNLKELYLDFNKISDLPVNLLKSNSIEIIEASYNRIESLKGKLFQLPHLKEINLTNNPLKEITDLTSISATFVKLNVSFTLLPKEKIEELRSILDPLNCNLITKFQDKYPYHRFCYPTSMHILNFDDYLLDIPKQYKIPLVKSPLELAFRLKIHILTFQKLLRELSQNIKKYYRVIALTKPDGKKRFLQVPKIEILNKTQNLIFKEILGNIEMGEFSYGFVKKHSTKMNAANHLNSKLLINLDLKNFFYSIKGDQVFNAFKSLGLSSGISSILTRFVTYYDSKNPIPFLPQGTHVSPSIANLVFKPLDPQLAAIAQYFGFRYSRYGDDLSFSSPHLRYAPSEFISQIFSILRKNGFTVNQKKISFMRPYKKQVVTGILVNGNECAIPRKLVKRIRAGLFQLDKFNVEIDQKLHIYGLCRYAKYVNSEKYGHLLERFQEIEPEFEEEYESGSFHETYKYIKEEYDF